MVVSRCRRVAKMLPRKERFWLHPFYSFLETWGEVIG